MKPVERLHAAYNDAAGVTAEFNRNVLRVLNRELQADFDPTRFDHVAFYNAASAQIEMHLRARAAHTVRIAALDLTVAFAAGETIHTESSRKFTRATRGAMLRRRRLPPGAVVRSRAMGRSRWRSATVEAAR